jgi:hypothetical protein
VKTDGLAVVDMIFPDPGSYMVFIQYTPFVYDVQLVWIVNTPNARVLFSPKRNLAQLTLTVLDQGGRPVGADVEVDFPGWPADVDPYEMLTDNAGQVYINCVSRGGAYIRDVILVEINDATYGCFNGLLTLPDSSSSIQVQLNPFACGQ